MACGGPSLAVSRIRINKYVHFVLDALNLVGYHFLLDFSFEQ